MEQVINTAQLPESILAQPLDYGVPVPLEQCAYWLENVAQRHEIDTTFTSISPTSTRYTLVKHIGRLYSVEASGYLIRRGEADTIVVGQVRISLYTYAITLLLALLALVFLQTVFALIFALLFLRMVMALVVSGSVCKLELAQVIEDGLSQAVRARKNADYIPESAVPYPY